ncbi:hypothetical protein ANN_07913 [Periplaneta americana]|uniref:Uncharacterized protein n=1 Tax=Periplaneta americana TaxID=6978 RepID=A0ABQ8T268_PERAM|nr:hypothetical protein ANN_07913 [Periplaneta americana]
MRCMIAGRTRGSDSGGLVAMATAQPAFSMAAAASAATATTASASDLVGGGSSSGGGGTQQGQQGVSPTATVTVVASPPTQPQASIVSANSVSITAVTHQTLQQRLNKSCQLQQQAADDDDLFSRLIFSDEATFHTSGKINKHNCRVWGTQKLHRIIEHECDSPKVNAFCALSQRKLYGPFFFIEATVTGHSYLDVLEQWLQDGAPPHFHNAVRAYLNTEMSDRWIGCAGVRDRCFMTWPPRSPDMTACDFFLWGYLNDRVFVSPLPRDLEELKTRIREAAATVTEDMLKRAWEEFDYRLDMCRNGSVDGSLDSPSDSSNGGGASNGSTAQVTAQVVVSSDTAAVNAGSSEQNGSAGGSQSATGTTTIVGSPHYITVTEKVKMSLDIIIKLFTNFEKYVIVNKTVLCARLSDTARSFPLRIVGSIFFAETVNTEVYGRIFTKFVKQINDVDLTEGYFQQDGAKSHPHIEGVCETLL